MITRAMAEIRRLGVGCGANADTFTGLSGLGDLTVTCFSKLSRNRGFGERLGRAKTRDVLAGMTSVAEVIHFAIRLPTRPHHKVTTPIIDEVYRMLYEGKTLPKACGPDLP